MRVLCPFVCCALACATSKPPPQAPAASPSLIDGALAAPKLDPVPDPPARLVSGRLTNLGASLARMSKWSTRAMPRSDRVTELLVGQAVGPLVDLEQPVDFAILVEHGPPARPLFAISAAIKDVETAEAALSQRLKLVEGNNGVRLIRGEGTTHDDRNRRACELAPAYGRAPMRLVCGANSAALSELGPWLTRTATRTGSRADLHVELRRPALHVTPGEKEMVTRAVDGMLGPWLVGSTSNALSKYLSAGLADFVFDLDTASLDVRIDDAGASASATFHLAGSSSALGRLAAAKAEGSAPPPQAFWQLPGDADFAFYNRGIDASEVQHWRDAALANVEPDNDGDTRPTLRALLKFLPSSPIAYAGGVDFAAMASAFAAQEAIQNPMENDDANRVAIAALLGWRVMEVDEPPARMAGALKELAGSWGGVAALQRATNTVPTLLRVAPIPRILGPRKGTQHLVWEVPWNNPEDLLGGCRDPRVRKSGLLACPPERPRKPLAIHLLLVPEGDRTWMGLGGDEAMVASKLAAAIAGSGDNLGARAELASLRSESVGTAGLTTWRWLVESQLLTQLLWEGGVRHPVGIREWLKEAPTWGESPLVFSVTAGSTTGSAPIVAKLRVSPGTVKDVLDTVLRHP
jgi:hypothetical protein